MSNREIRPSLDLQQFDRFFSLVHMRLAWPNLITKIYLGQSKVSKSSSKSSARSGLVRILVHHCIFASTITQKSEKKIPMYQKVDTKGVNLIKCVPLHRI